ncbi:MAG: OmpA family protein [Bacteroidia bacterium]|nr:OmpA family protein [Bacteroidia bacterium]
MRNFLFIISTFLFAFNTAFSQSIGPYKIGDIVNETIEVYDTNKVAVQLKIPAGDNYLVVYNYRWINAGKGVDIPDSLKLLEEKLAEIIIGGMIGKLNVVCIAYDKNEKFDEWISLIKKGKPVKANTRYKVDYYNLYNNGIGEIKAKQLLSKLTIFGPDGKILCWSSSIGAFKYHKTNARISLKAKLVTSDSKGKKTPLNNALVHVDSGNQFDTIAQTRTDKYGDFELNLPNDKKKYKIKVKPEDEKVKNISILTRQGAEVQRMELKATGFEYELLNADIIYLAEIQTEDIALKYDLFNSAARMKELDTDEIIFYETAKSDIRKESEVILNKIVKILNDNPKVNVEVISHTDANGDEAANMELSTKRAIAVANYFIKSGISDIRIKTAGKGETQIRNRCGNGVACPDKEHEYNRRTEFKFSR